MKKHPKKYCPDGPISTKTKMYKIHLSFIVLGIYNFVMMLLAHDRD